MKLAVLSALLILGAAPSRAEPAWPGKEWARAAPQEQGMKPQLLDEAAAYAQRFGGGSGCVVRGGFLVKEWGDPAALADIKSCTKGAVGTTVLGLAVDAGLLKLD